MNIRSKVNSNWPAKARIKMRVFSPEKFYDSNNILLRRTGPSFFFDDSFINYVDYIGPVISGKLRDLSETREDLKSSLSKGDTSHINTLSSRYVDFRDILHIEKRWFIESPSPTALTNLEFLRLLEHHAGTAVTELILIAEVSKKKGFLIDTETFDKSYQKIEHLVQALDNFNSPYMLESIFCLQLKNGK